ncbi:MAG: hypothetical protein P1V51_05430 [Deltaproteobacteria bacterium]|nr:hypothetical protein [Deltaproteobacteria bacterium]
MRFLFAIGIAALFLMPGCAGKQKKEEAPPPPPAEETAPAPAPAPAPVSPL